MVMYFHASHLAAGQLRQRGVRVDEPAHPPIEPTLLCSTVMCGGRQPDPGLTRKQQHGLMQSTVLFFSSVLIDMSPAVDAWVIPLPQSGI